MAIKIHLAKILGERKMKVAELARQTGISGYALYNVYHERTKGVEFGTLEKLCQALDCSVGDLLEYVPEEE
jgi:putative transcriptional regulator